MNMFALSSEATEVTFDAVSIIIFNVHSTHLFSGGKRANTKNSDKFLSHTCYHVVRVHVYLLTKVI